MRAVLIKTFKKEGMDIQHTSALPIRNSDTLRSEATKGSTIEHCSLPTVDRNEQNRLSDITIENSVINRVSQ